MNHDFDVDAFLRKPLFAHLATMSDDGPRESPVWFLWEAGALWLIGSNRDSFPKRIRSEPRCAVGIVEFELQRGVLRHVGIRGIGTIEVLDQERLHRLLKRYLGPEETGWNQRFRSTVIDRLELMVRIEPTSMVARNQSYFSNAAPGESSPNDPEA
jgi:nitroimidazol reductase NimA-like FMN-containing flavoprotein (pyridoxamine 5'-phosphate oxidase superfamily)